MSDNLPQYKNRLDSLKEIASQRPLVKANPTPKLNRLTAVVRITHDCVGEETKDFQVGYQQHLSIAEEQYSRKHTATESWSTLDLGPLPSGNIGTVIIKNIEGEKGTRNLTPEEKEELSRKVLQIKADFIPTIGPGECFYCHTAYADKIQIRSANGNTEYRVFIIPR